MQISQSAGASCLPTGCRSGTLDDVERSIEINLARALPGLERHREEVGERAYPYVRHEDVDAAESLHSAHDNLQYPWPSANLNQR